MTTLDTLINLAIAEDIGSGDVTTEATIPAGLKGAGIIRAKGDIVVAGIRAAKRVYEIIDPSLEFNTVMNDGAAASKGEIIAKVSGSLASILKGERIVLNFLQHLSGVATLTREFARRVEGTNIEVLDTRKTIPGYRELEKEAVRLGGAENHRLGLFDRYLIKDNHIEAAGSIKDAIASVKAANKKLLPVEVEVKNLDEIETACSMGVDIVMLDNFKPEELTAAVKKVAGRSKIEISGNIDINNIQKYAVPGIDFISIGAITHSAPAADIHMLVE